MSRVRTRGAHWPSGRSGIEKPRGSGTARGRAKGLEENEAGPSGGGGRERGILNIEDRVMRAGPSGLGDLEVTEYIARILSGPFEGEDDASVHLATTEARFMPD